MNWVPRPFDVEWTRRLIAGFKHDVAFWGVPMNNTIYRFDMPIKLISLIDGQKDDLFDRLTAIAKILGWTTVHRPQPITPEIHAQAFPESLYGKGKSNQKPPTQVS